MNDISFKAKLIINDNLYNKMPKDTPDNYTDNLVKEYEKFLNNQTIKKITDGDTIELSKASYQKGFALGITYHSDKLEKPITSGIYTKSKIPTVRVGELIHDTMAYIIIKSGIEQKYFESFQNSFIRAVKTLLEKDNN